MKISACCLFVRKRRVRKGNLFLGCSNETHGTAAPASPGSLLEMQDPRSHQLLTQNQLPTRSQGELACSGAKSCPALCDSMDCSPPGSSVHGILQARILEWVARPFSRGSSWYPTHLLVSLAFLQAGSLPLNHLGNPGRVYAC